MQQKWQDIWNSVVNLNLIVLRSIVYSEICHTWSCT